MYIWKSNETDILVYWYHIYTFSPYHQIIIALNRNGNWSASELFLCFNVSSYNIFLFSVVISSVSLCGFGYSICLCQSTLYFPLLKILYWLKKCYTYIKVSIKRLCWLVLKDQCYYFCRSFSSFNFRFENFERAENVDCRMSNVWGMCGVCCVWFWCGLFYYPILYRFLGLKNEYIALNVCWFIGWKVVCYKIKYNFFSFLLFFCQFRAFLLL